MKVEITKPMKVKILKSFFLDGVQYKKGEVANVTPNLAHGLYESRLALAYQDKGLDEPRQDKMMTRKRKLRTK